MPELPDITVYVEALERRIVGESLEGVRVRSPFLIRTFDPPMDETHGKIVREIRRLGKRIVLGFEGNLWLILHLMVAGRLHWKPPGAKFGGRTSLAAFDFASGCLLLTEAGTKHRASLFLARGEENLRGHDPGGIEVLTASFKSFCEALKRENRTLKRALTDPRLFSGIGNSYSDEILHRARLSPLLLSRKLTDTQASTLFEATCGIMHEWTDRLREETGNSFPGKVTAFREGMAVHGKFGEPCPVCSLPVQRIRYADNETNYCAKCQTGGRVLADRSLSRLLKDDWPSDIDEL